MIAVAFRSTVNTMVPIYGFVTGISWQQVYDYLRDEVKCNPHDCEFVQIGLFFSAQILVQGDDYVPSRINTNIYELATEALSWERVDWDGLLGQPFRRKALGKFEGQLSPFDGTISVDDSELPSMPRPTFLC